MSTKIEVQTERSLRCSYKLVCFDKSFLNEYAMFTSPMHGSNRNKVQFIAAKETKNNGIKKKRSKMALYEKKTALYSMFFSKIKTRLYFFTIFAFDLTYKCSDHFA